MLGADANKDGKISAAELTAHGDQKKRDHFAQKDTNKDGFLGSDELGERWARLSAADADKDNRISLDEMQKAMSDGKLGFGPGHRRGFRHGDPAQFLKSFDANGNGSVELSELPEHKRDKLGAADTNGDKLLSGEELKSFFDAKRKSRPNPAPTGGTSL